MNFCRDSLVSLPLVIEREVYMPQQAPYIFYVFHLLWHHKFLISQHILPLYIFLAYPCKKLDR